MDTTSARIRLKFICDEVIVGETVFNALIFKNVCKLLLLYLIALRQYRRRSKGGTILCPPPMAGGWRGGPAAAGLNGATAGVNKMKNIRQERGVWYYENYNYYERASAAASELAKSFFIVVLGDIHIVALRALR